MLGVLGLLGRIRASRDAVDAGDAGDAGGFPLQSVLVKSDHFAAVRPYWGFRINLCKLSN